MAERRSSRELSPENQPSPSTPQPVEAPSGLDSTSLHRADPEAEAYGIADSSRSSESDDGDRDDDDDGDRDSDNDDVPGDNPWTAFLGVETIADNFHPVRLAPTSGVLAFLNDLPSPTLQLEESSQQTHLDASSEDLEVRADPIPLPHEGIQEQHRYGSPRRNELSESEYPKTLTRETAAEDLQPSTKIAKPASKAKEQTGTKLKEEGEGESEGQSEGAGEAAQQPDPPPPVAPLPLLHSLQDDERFLWTRKWQGKTQQGVHLCRHDTWASTPRWTRHVRIIDGVNRSALSKARPMDSGQNANEPGEWRSVGFVKHGTW